MPPLARGVLPMSALGCGKGATTPSRVENPAENVRQSQWYDHLLSTNNRVRAYRTQKKGGQIVNDRELRNDCIRSRSVNTSRSGPRLSGDGTKDLIIHLGSANVQSGCCASG